MAEEAEGVQAGSPTAEEQAAAQAAEAQQAAQQQETDEQGVPWKNRMAEMERRAQGWVQQGIQAAVPQIIQALAAQQRPAQQTGRSIDQYTDDELAALHAQGHLEASRELIGRETTRRMQAQTIQQAQAFALTQAQQEVAELYQAYPQLQDSSSDLYRTANQFYQQRAALRGQNIFTQLDAIKTALLRHQGQAVVSEQTRRTGADANQAIGAVSHGRPPQRGGPAPKLTREEVALAQRMNVKDPAGAKARLVERINSGKVVITPNASAALGDV